MKLFEEDMMLQLSETHGHHKRHPQKGHGQAKFSIPRGLHNLAHKIAPHGYDFSPHKMAKQKAHRKQKKEHKIHQLSHKRAHKEAGEEEEFSKTLHNDVENGIEEQGFVKKSQLHNDPAADLGRRTKTAHRHHEEEEEIPHKKSHKKLKRELDEDDEVGTRKLAR